MTNPFNFNNPVATDNVHLDELESLLEKVHLFDALIDAKGAIDLVDAAQCLRMGRNTMIKRLRDEKILQKRKNRPYQRYIDRGYFLVTPTVDATYGLRATTRVTAVGMVYISKRSTQGGESQ